MLTHAGSLPLYRQQLSTEPTLSFEVMPPRNPEAAPQFWGTVEKLLSARPDFLSITYGAAGQDRRGAREVAELLARQSPAAPIAHFTCVRTSADEVRSTVARYLDSGVRTFLALRGDPPAACHDWDPRHDEVRSACDLIHLIRHVEARRIAQHPGAALRASVHPLTIGVATFPEGNAAVGTTPQQEVERLLAKEIAGATFAITQLFWEADTYFSFLELARSAGVTIPIIPGILPATDPQRLKRVAELTAVKLPISLVRALERADSPQTAHALGVGASASLVTHLLRGGSPGIHLYTFNKSKPVLDILSAAGVIEEEN